MRRPTKRRALCLDNVGHAASPVPGEDYRLITDERAAKDEFVHIVDERGKTVAQQDAQPGGGTIPTSGWLAGEVVTTTSRMPVESSWGQGPYRLRVGLYDPVTGRRLSLAGRTDDNVVIGLIGP